MNQKHEISISPWSIVSAVLILVLIYFLYFIRDILVLFFIVLILAATFRPIVNRWEKSIYRLPAVLSLIIIAVFIIALISYVVFPPLILQFKEFISSIPDLINRFNFSENYKKVLVDNTRSIANNPSAITGGFINITTGLFGGFVSFITVIVLTVYLLLEKNGINHFVANLFPEERQSSVLNITKKIAEKVGSWFRGQMLLCLCMGIIYFIILSILKVPYALPLAVIAMILEIVPTIGPIISGVIAMLVALTVSPLVAIIAGILFIITSQLENSFLVPKIMQKAVGLSPIIIILAIIIGAKILGIAGALIAVPVVASLSVIVKDWALIKKTFQPNG